MSQAVTDQARRTLFREADKIHHGNLVGAAAIQSSGGAICHLLVLHSTNLTFKQD